MDSEKQLKNQNNISIKNCQAPEVSLSSSSKESSDASEHSFVEFEKQFDFPAKEETSQLNESVSHQALENIKNIFDKTQTIRKVANVKHQEIQSQFNELRNRLNHSSECLQRMQKGINNIKFSYQSKIYEMQHSLTPGDFFDPEKNPLQTKADMAKHMEEIRNKIENIQNQVYTEKEKQEKVMRSYKDAFDNVSCILENIDKGSYSSLKNEDTKKKI